MARAPFGNRIVIVAITMHPPSILSRPLDRPIQSKIGRLRMSRPRPQCQFRRPLWRRFGAYESSRRRRGPASDANIEMPGWGMIVQSVLRGLRQRKDRQHATELGVVGQRLVGTD